MNNNYFFPYITTKPLDGDWKVVITENEVRFSTIMQNHIDMITKEEKAIGACIIQIKDNKWKIIGRYSMTLKLGMNLISLSKLNEKMGCEANLD